MVKNMAETLILKFFLFFVRKYFECKIFFINFACEINQYSINHLKLIEHGDSKADNTRLINLTIHAYEENFLVRSIRADARSLLK